MSDTAKCVICGEPMPAGEEMFKYHGYSGDCPKPPLPKPPVNQALPASGHTAQECSEAFEWLRTEATKDGADPRAGVALDEWAAMSLILTPNVKLTSPPISTGATEKKA